MGVGSMGSLARTAPAFVSFTRRLKQAIDPDGMLAPGKYGA
jgi:FAD/FMN-containing dehydrogenase